LTPLTLTLDACLLPGPVTTFVVPFAFVAPFALPAPPFALPLLGPLPGLLERVDDELTPQPLDDEDEDDDDDEEEEDDDNDDDDVDDD